MKNISIPCYSRNTPTFKETFNISPGKVIQKMDAAGDDIPHQLPAFPVQIARAGVIRKNIPVIIRNPFNRDTFSQVNCDINLMTGVPRAKRGLHMSRISNLVAHSISEIISESATVRYDSLQEYAMSLAKKLGESQYGETSSIEVSGSLSYLEHVAGWKEEKNKISLEQIILKASAEYDGDAFLQSAGIEFSNISACPCVQQTYKHALSFDNSLEVSPEIPLLTHSQRCISSVIFHGITQELPIMPLLETLDAVIVRTQNTLPREYELLNVYRAHNQPQFMEDAVRQMLQGVYNLFKDTFPESTVKIFSLSMESIHDYDIIAEIAIRLKDIQTSLTEQGTDFS